MRPPGLPVRPRRPGGWWLAGQALVMTDTAVGTAACATAGTVTVDAPLEAHRPRARASAAIPARMAIGPHRRRRRRGSRPGGWAWSGMATVPPRQRARHPRGATSPPRWQPQSTSCRAPSGADRVDRWAERWSSEELGGPGAPALRPADSRCPWRWRPAGRRTPAGERDPCPGVGTRHPARRRGSRRAAEAHRLGHGHGHRHRLGAGEGGQTGETQVGDHSEAVTSQQRAERFSGYQLHDQVGRMDAPATSSP